MISAPTICQRVDRLPSALRQAACVLLARDQRCVVPIDIDQANCLPAGGRDGAAACSCAELRPFSHRPHRQLRRVGHLESECLPRHRRCVDGCPSWGSRMGGLGVAFRQDDVARHRFGDHRRCHRDGGKVYLHAHASQHGGQSVSLVPARVQLQFSERRGGCLGGAWSRPTSSNTLAITLRHMRSCCCRCTWVRGASRIKRIGRPMCWPAGRWGACPAGSHTVGRHHS